MAINSSGSMNLYLNARGAAAADSLPLFVWGHTSGALGAVPLFVQGASGAASGGMNLALLGPPSAAATGWLNLSVEGSYPGAAGWVPLYLDVFDGATGSLPLFLKGSGLTAGGMPADGYLNLFIQRKTDAAIPLFVLAPGTPSASGVDAFVRGKDQASGSLTFYVSGVGPLTASLTCFARGF